ncbi:tribbles homolog 3 [Alligator sinensis]|uniref:Tribbles homolog 3 n=1 Tax=Alligator sinensis TaxID=38654 RepID=A0A3Q0HC03_ALLSI|nr:tribbles homolog 3 [Alligator sinensis]
MRTWKGLWSKSGKQPDTRRRQAGQREACEPQVHSCFPSSHIHPRRPDSERGEESSGDSLRRMSMTMLKILGTAPLRKKRLDSGEAPDAESPKAKRPRLGPLPGFVPCLQPLAPSRSNEEHDARVLQIGPYVLLEPRDGGRSYRAVHRPTEAEYSCKVYPMRSYQEAMAPYGRLPPHPSVARGGEAVQGDRGEAGRVRGAGAAGPGGRLNAPLQPGTGCGVPGAQRTTDLPSTGPCPGDAMSSRCPGSWRLPGRGGGCGLWVWVTLVANTRRTRLVLESLEDACVLSGPDDALSDKHGCPAYVGPEILHTRPRYSGKAADVWSLGVVLYTMLVGRYPFQEAEPTLLFSKIRHGAFAIPGGLSPRARCLVRCLLRKTPAERLSTPGILLHPWLAGGGGATQEPCSGPSWRRGLDQVVPDVRGRRDEEEQEEDLYS